MEIAPLVGQSRSWIPRHASSEDIPRTDQSRDAGGGWFIRGFHRRLPLEGSDIFIVVFSIVYGPYFASIETGGLPSLSFVMPAPFSLILVSLDDIQAHLENPFDPIGVDDIEIHADRLVRRLEELEQPAEHPPRAQKPEFVS